jgi:hypothetical protein
VTLLAPRGAGRHWALRTALLSLHLVAEVAAEVLVVLAAHRPEVRGLVPASQAHGEDVVELPGEIPVHAELETGERVDIQVEVTREGARASRVCVETDSPKGVGSVMLRRVPVRNAMATGCYLHLLRVNRQPDGTVGLMPDDVNEEDVPIVTRMIERLIGYERLRREEGRS